jgi:membrane-bound lytic murein transglycosylase B
MAERFLLLVRCPLAVLVLMMLLASAPVGSSLATGHNPFADLQQKLIEDGFDADTIIALYNQPEVTFESNGVSLFFVHSEAKLDYDQFTNNWSIKQARKYMQEHQAALQRIETEYGVDKEVITAIILVETGLGRTLGTRSILNTLSSLAALEKASVRDDLWASVSAMEDMSRQSFEHKADRKAKWAYRELKAFLSYVLKEEIDPRSVHGSYAGALGIPQFMPTNIVAYARDGDMDGHIDLFNHADAMASIASYLKRYGWKPGINQAKAKQIVHRYNHSEYYVNTILKISARLKG